MKRCQQRHLSFKCSCLCPQRGCHHRQSLPTLLWSTDACIADSERFRFALNLVSTASGLATVGIDRALPSATLPGVPPVSLAAPLQAPCRPLHLQLHRQQCYRQCCPLVGLASPSTRPELRAQPVITTPRVTSAAATLLRHLPVAGFTDHSADLGHLVPCRLATPRCHARCKCLGPALRSYSLHYRPHHN